MQVSKMYIGKKIANNCWIKFSFTCNNPI